MKLIISYWLFFLSISSSGKCIQEILIAYLYELKLEILWLLLLLNPYIEFQKCFSVVDQQ